MPPHTPAVFRWPLSSIFRSDLPLNLHLVWSYLTEIQRERCDTILQTFLWRSNRLFFHLELEHCSRSSDCSFIPSFICHSAIEISLTIAEFFKQTFKLAPLFNTNKWMNECWWHSNHQTKHIASRRYLRTLSFHRLTFLYFFYYSTDEEIVTRNKKA